MTAATCLDEFRYRTVDAIVAELDTRRHPLRVAIQNWEHDFNIGSIVRTANAFNVAGVHILGRRRWNRRGAMVTDRYLHVHHHPDVASFAAAMAEEGCAIVGVDNLPGSVPLETVRLPERVCLVFGSEGPGLTDELVEACEQTGVDQPVRLDPLPERRRRGGHRHVSLGAAVGISAHSSLMSTFLPPRVEPWR